MCATSHGFTSPGVVKQLLQYGADYSVADGVGDTAASCASILLHTSTVWNDPHSEPPLPSEYDYETGEPIREVTWRAPGVVEDMLALLRGVEAAGSWKRYVREPRRDLLTFRRLVERGRAAPPDEIVLARLFAGSRARGLPDVLFWKVLSFWRSERDA